MGRRLSSARWLRQPAVWVLLLAIMVWAALDHFSASSLRHYEERITDSVWRAGGRHVQERRLVIVDIDERSLREIGPWPWPRETQAQLLEALASQGVSHQILDIVLTESRAGDERMAQAIKSHQPVLAQVFAFAGQGEQVQGGQLAAPLSWPQCASPFAAASGYLGNAPQLARAAGAAGHITPRLERDGVVRRQPAIICHGDKAYPALALAALMQATGDTQLTLVPGQGWLGPQWTLLGSQQAWPAVPLDSQGDLRVPWRLHPDSFVSVSAADVLARRTPPELLRQAWALVGSSAFGLNDTIATPYSAAAAGLQVHAQLITALIDGELPQTPRHSPWLQAVAAALGLALLAWLAREPAAQAVSDHPTSRRRRPTYLLPLWGLAWALILLGLHALLLLQAQIWVGWLQPALLVVLAGFIWGAAAHARSRLDRDRLYTHLSSYLPAPVAAALALQPPSSAIRASTREVSVLFADIRNFSAYCEARPPDEAAAVLHAFFTTATRVVQQHGGIIEAFQGDAVLAVWYSPDPSGADSIPGHPRHAQRALQAAGQLLQAMQGVLPDPAPAGLEPLALGIGIETGPAMTGSFGLASRRTHMVMGRTVTIAGRLVSMTADLAHPILVGEGLAAQVSREGLQSLGTFLLDGMRVPHHIYAPPLQSALPLYNLHTQPPAEDLFAADLVPEDEEPLSTDVRQPRVQRPSTPDGARPH